MTFTTRIKATSHFTNILGSVLGQMSDGIWENTRSMEKYWKSLSYTVNPDGYIVIIDITVSVLTQLTSLLIRLKRLFKSKLKTEIIIFIGIEVVQVFLSICGTPTVGDCYLLYELQRVVIPVNILTVLTQTIM